MHDLRGNAQSQAQAGVAASNHRPLITLDPYKALGSHDQRKTQQSSASNRFEDCDLGLS
jgi:hypothetical protein